MNRTNYTPSSELHRTAEQAVRNEERLAKYRRRKSNVISLPRRETRPHSQYEPDGPEAA